jgi:hypothetical protein
MIDVILKISNLLRVVTVWVENLLQTPFSATTRDDIEGRIETLNKERNKIYMRHALFTRARHCC